MIVFDSVTRAYGETAAIKQVTFVIDPGEMVLIVGPSGAGKSTVGKLLIREVSPTEGEIRVGDFAYSTMKRKDIPVLRQQIGMVFQDYRLLPDRTAAENVALSLEIMNKSQAVVEKTVSELLKVVGLEGKEHLFPHQLSGGESQRVVIARALGTDPAVIFADEPTGNLDVDTGAQIVDLLRKINLHGTTVLMATHDERLKSKLGCRVITLKNGELIHDSKPKPIPTETVPEVTPDEAETKDAAPGPKKPKKETPA